MKIALFLAVLVAVAVAAKPKVPTPPTWPDAFSASVRAEDAFGQQRWFRWFYDFDNKLERFDGMVDWHGSLQWAEVIADHSTGDEYAVFYEHDEVTCIIRPVNQTMLKPDFSKFNYAGQSLVNYIACNHWMLRDQKEHAFFQLWDRQDNREVLRFEVSFRGRDETWTFMELDDGAQDASLFTLPPIIQNMCFSP